MNYAMTSLARPSSVKVSQMPFKQVDKAMDTYLKNAYVCLSSIKLYNPDTECLLLTDFELSEQWNERFKKSNIKLRHVPFGNFALSNDFNWNITQYKFDVLNYMASVMSDDDKLIFMDNDIICVDSLFSLYEEISDDVICLFDIQHSLENSDRKRIIENYKRVYPENPFPNCIHYGGEFVGSNGKNLKLLLSECDTAFQKLKNVSGIVDFNDENLFSFAADRIQSKIKIKNANAYIYRYWTAAFYLVSTNWINNPVVLWHLPTEKGNGIIWVYNYLISKGLLPPKQKMASYFRFPLLPKKYGITSMRYYFNRLIFKLKKY